MTSVKASVLQSLAVRMAAGAVLPENLLVAFAQLEGFNAFPCQNMPGNYVGSPELVDAWKVGFEAAATQSQRTVEEENSRQRH